MQLLAIFVLTSLVSHPAQLSAQDLGERREAFGDPIFDIDTKKGAEEYEWRFRGTFHGYQTEVYFPAGKSDERFYINDVTYKSGAESQLTLQYETKHNGVIRLVWSVPLDMFSPAPISEVYEGSMDSMGSMERMLWRRGLRILQPVNSVIRARLNVREGYAGYWTGMAMSNNFWYWFSGPDGVPSKAQSLDFFEITRIIARKALPASKGLPQLGIPYPITFEESKYCGLK